MITKDQILEAIKFHAGVLKNCPELAILIHQRNIQINRASGQLQLYKMVNLIDRYHRGDVLVRPFNNGVVLFYNRSEFELGLNNTE